MNKIIAITTTLLASNLAFAGWGLGYNIEVVNKTGRDMQVSPYNCALHYGGTNDMVKIKDSSGTTKTCTYKTRAQDKCTAANGSTITGYCAASFWHEASLSMKTVVPGYDLWSTRAEFRVPKVGASALWFHSTSNTSARTDNAYVSYWSSVINKTVKKDQKEGIWDKTIAANKDLKNTSGHRYSVISGAYSGMEAYGNDLLHDHGKSMPFAVAWTTDRSSNNMFFAVLGEKDVYYVEDKAMRL